VRASRVRAGSGRGDGLVLSTTMVRQVLDDGVSLLTTDAQRDPRFSQHESVILQGTRAAMAAPLFDNQRIIGLLYADTTDPSSLYGPDDLRAFTVLANLIAVKMTQARLTEAEEEKRRLTRELAAAREILGHILPEQVEGVGDYGISVAYEPCTEVGGDLYDVRHLDDGRSVILAGDVAGKGLGAAILVSSIVPTAQVLLGDGRDLVVGNARAGPDLHLDGAEATNPALANHFHGEAVGSGREALGAGLVDGAEAAAGVNEGAAFTNSEGDRFLAIDVFACHCSGFEKICMGIRRRRDLHSIYIFIFKELHVCFGTCVGVLSCNSTKSFLCILVIENLFGSFKLIPEKICHRNNVDIGLV
jgi:hypothetical protein